MLNLLATGLGPLTPLQKHGDLCATLSSWGELGTPPLGRCPQEARVFVQVCATPGDARGYDPGLGLCLCWGQYSSGTCGPLCSEEQKHVLQLSCSEGIPQISITEDTKSQVQCALGFEPMLSWATAEHGPSTISLCFLRGSTCDYLCTGSRCCSLTTSLAHSLVPEKRPLCRFNCIL